MESLESGISSPENQQIEVPEAVNNEGPTVLVGLGLQLTAENERLTARTWHIPDILWMKVANETIGNTSVFITGGYTGQNREDGSEAELMFQRMCQHLEYLKEEHLTAIKGDIILHPRSVSLINGPLELPTLSRDGHWIVPVYIDTDASSLLENFKYVPQDRFNNEESLIALFAGPARPSANRAAYVASGLFPNAKIETFEGQEGSEMERIKRAIKEEGIAAALQETTLAENGIKLATQMGLGKMLNKITAKRIKD